MSRQELRHFVGSLARNLAGLRDFDHSGEGAAAMMRTRLSCLHEAETEPGDRKMVGGAGLEPATLGV